jgi:YD repeat-containing protein
VRDANSRERETFYDILGRVEMVHNEMSQPVIYRYDDASRRYELEDAKGNVTEYKYDDDNRLTKMIYPAVAGEPENVEDYRYDGAGLLKKKITPNGDEIGYGYDGAGRLASVSFGDRAVGYGRDGAGAVTSIGGLQDVTTIGYVYDGFGRMTSASDSALGKTIAYSYDRRGLRTRMELPGPGGAVVGYTYDDAMRLEGVQRHDEANPAAYLYDSGGRRKDLVLPNGVMTHYAYDGNDRLDVLTTTGPAGVLASFDYDVDDTGNREGITYADGSKSDYEFDEAYRLTKETRTNRGPAPQPTGGRAILPSRPRRPSPSRGRRSRWGSRERRPRRARRASPGPSRRTIPARAPSSWSRRA